MNKLMEKLKTASAKDLIFYSCLIFLPILHFVIFYVIVNVRSLTYVFQEYNGKEYVFAGLGNFNKVFNLLSDPYFLGAIKNSCVVFLIGLAINTPLGLLFANYIYKKAAGSMFFRVVLFLPSIIPTVVLTMLFTNVTDVIIPALAKILNPDSTYLGMMYDIASQFKGLVIYSLFTGFGTSVLLYVGTMTAIPESVVEAAELDGCGDVREFFSITLPYIWPTFIIFFATSLGGVFTNQFNVYTFEGQDADPTIWTVGYYLFAQTEAATFYDYPRLATLGIFFTLIIAPLSIGVRWAMNKFGYSAE